VKELRPVKAGWYNAFRPWTLHGAVVPVLIGGAAAYTDGHFSWWLFVLVLIGACLLQSAANLLNTYGDYVRGADTVENSLRSPELVTGTLEPKNVLLAGAGCLVVTALIGLVFIWQVGWGILPFGLLGIAGASLYTIGVAYKYHGLGLLSVFFLMGILMPAGTYYVLSVSMSMKVLLLSLPNAFLITAVLSGNETRDYYEDRKAAVRTLSSRLSYEGSMRLYLFLNSIPFPLLLLFIALGALPWTTALSLLTLYDLYLVVKNSRSAPTDPASNLRLVPLSFRLNWHFGVLLVVGYLFGYNIISGWI